jgi:hypothetical protein
MALPWTDFVWTIKRWLSLYPLDAISNLPASIPSSGNYTIGDADYYLVSTNATDVTYALPSDADTNRVLKFKNRGAGEVTISGTIFTDSVVTSLVLVIGDMVTLTYDGTYWNVGD